jgi:hypothetical protein
MLLGSSMLEVGVGMAFFYLLLAILCSSINEVIARFWRLRAKTLKSGIASLLADPTTTGIAAELYRHPLVKRLEKSNGMPSYLHARTFAAAFVDSISQGATTVGAVKADLLTNPLVSDELRRQLTIILNDAGNDMAALKAGIATWYDDAMDRVSGWYKRKAQAITFVVALVVTVLINADTLKLANSMIQNPAARDAFIAQASALAPATSGGGVPTTDIAAVKEAMAPLGVELGYPDVNLGDLGDIGRYVTSPVNWLGHIPGWLITTLAILMGAPFWFDLISKVANIRSSGNPPPSSSSVAAGGA